MSDDEDDYMSLKFLEGAQEFESKRQETYSERRKRQLRENEEKSRTKSRAQLEVEEREKGLNRSIEKSNKGMKMLMKMGFKSGSGLGKEGGITEPLQVDLKSDRMGLGMATKRAHELEEQEKQLKKMRNEIDPEDYRVMMAQRVKEQQNYRYLTAAVSICEDMDVKEGIESNILWICKPMKTEGDEEEVKALEKDREEKEALYPETEVKKLKELSIAEQVEKVIDYLRTKHCYCFWCSAKYNDKEDLGTHCPGPNEDDH